MARRTALGELRDWLEGLSSLSHFTDAEQKKVSANRRTCTHIKTKLRLEQIPEQTRGITLCLLWSQRGSSSRTSSTLPEIEAASEGKYKNSPFNVLLMNQRHKKN